MYLGEIGWSGMEWLGLAHNRDQWKALVKAVINFRVPKNAGEFSSVCKTGGLPRRATVHGVS
jgi:hypothetical protein